MIKKFPKKRIPSTVLALALDGNRLEGAVVRRSNGSLKVLQTVSATLALNPLNSDPELFGRELRNNLEAAGIKERNCAVCVPLSWALTIQVKVPAMPETDIPSFLEIEAERGFPYAPETLLTAVSLCDAAGGEKLATIGAVPRNHLLQLEKAVRAAQLKPMGFTLGITALHPAEQDTNRGVLTIAVGENTVDLQITINNGVAILRSLDGAIEIEGAQRRIDADALAREIRVTLGQLPMELRGSIRTALIFGMNELAQRLVSEIRPKLEAMRMEVQVVSAFASNAFRSQYPANTTPTPALSAAGRFLTGAATPFELLPPRVSAWQKITARVSSRKLGWAGVAAAAIFLLAGGAIGFQQWKMAQLRSEWEGMRGKVEELDGMQANIRKFRPWFDESLPNMSILKQLTEAFPAEGIVWTKTTEIRNQSSVICSGTARNNQAFTRVVDQLRSSPDVSKLSIDSVRGARQRCSSRLTFNGHQEEAEMKIENRQQILAAVAFAVVGLLLLDRLVITPLLDGWKERSKQITDLQTDILKGKSTLERGPMIRERWENMRTNTLATETAERKLLEAFQRWSDSSRISISSIQPQLKVEDDHATLECRAMASGNVNALAQFIYQMEKDPMALHVESLEVTSRDENGQTLSLALQVSGLILTVPQE